MQEILDEAEQAANPFLVDGAARTKDFVPQHADPSDDAGGPVPDEVWASDEFQDNLYAWSRAQSGPSIKPDSGERKIQYIRPKPGFVFKTVDKASNKIFVNVCSSIQVPEPPKITPEMLQDQKNPVRLPLSLGEPREDTDAKGKPCTVYDCVMHTDVLERTKTDAEMKEFVVELCMQWIEQKHSLLLNRRVKWPKGMQSKGDPEIQTIRRNTNRLFTPVSETVTPEPDPEPVEEQPDYAVSEEDDGKLLVILSLPKLDSADVIDLEHSSKRLFVVVQGMYKAAIPLPYAIAKSGAEAEFNKTRRQLSVWLKIAVQNVGADGGKGITSKTSGRKAAAPGVQIRNSLVTELD